MPTSDARVDLVMDTFHEIMEQWRIQNRFTYTVLANGPIRGVPLDEIRDSRFRVGAKGPSVELTLSELVGLFSLIADQANQLRQLPIGIRRVQIKTVLNLAPSDEEIARMLPHIEIVESGEEMC